MAIAATIASTAMAQRLPRNSPSMTHPPLSSIVRRDCGRNMKARADVRLADDVGPTFPPPLKLRRTRYSLGDGGKVGPYYSYSATMVSCGTTLMNGEKLAVR